MTPMTPEQISHLVLMFLLLTLNMWLPAGTMHILIIWTTLNQFSKLSIKILNHVSIGMFEKRSNNERTLMGEKILRDKKNLFQITLRETIS